MLCFLAAEQGHPASNYNLGFCYRHGDGVERDQVRAFKYFEKAATEGDVEAQFLVGSAYFHGTGVAVDLTQ